jgi:hypothetical protein
MRSSPRKFSRYEELFFNGRKIVVLVVSGTYYDMGRLYGAHFGAHIVTNSVERLPALVRTIGLLHRRGAGIWEDLDRARHTLLPNVPRQYREEMRGVYDGCREAGHRIEEIRAFEDLVTAMELGERECSMFAAQPPATSGETYQLRDLDYFLNINFQEQPLVLIRIPQDDEGHVIEVPYVSIDYGTPSGVITGMNAYGVVISEIRGSFIDRPTMQGEPLVHLIQDVLSQCRTAPEAVRLLRSRQRAAAYYLVISDPLQTPQSLKFLLVGPHLFHEMNHGAPVDLSVLSKEHLKFYEPLEGLVYWSEMEGGTVDGRRRDVLSRDIYDLLKAAWGRLGAEESLHIARALGNDASFTSVLFNSTSLEAWIAFADRKTPAHKNGYFHLDLKRYFRCP